MLEIVEEHWKFLASVATAHVTVIVVEFASLLLPLEEFLTMSLFDTELQCCSSTCMQTLTKSSAYNKKVEVDPPAILVMNKDRGVISLAQQHCSCCCWCCCCHGICDNHIESDDSVLEIIMAVACMGVIVLHMVAYMEMIKSLVWIFFIMIQKKHPRLMQPAKEVAWKTGMNMDCTLIWMSFIIWRRIMMYLVLIFSLWFEK